jgi:glycosyltransferase involved in cell wall biosynthesis
MTQPRLSVVVVAFNMARALPRTLQSLSPGLQTGLAPESYEIIVVDNGSAVPPNIEDCRKWGAQVRLLRVPNPSISPARAVNMGIEAAAGEIVGVMVDGARMASPGLLSTALLASRLDSRAVIASLGFHLGVELQWLAITRGYNEEVEDRLLEDSGWQTDPYRLFGISVLAGSSAGGWFAPIAESNGLFLPRALWKELGGFDERFRLAGGGFVNLDSYKRACELPDARLIVLLGEGTFHQVHGGAATNATPGNNQMDAFHAEYIELRGAPFVAPTVEPLFFGRVRRPVLPFLISSAASPQACASWATEGPRHETG